MKIFAAAGITMLGLLTLAYGGGSPKKEDVPKYLKMLTTSTNSKDRATAAEMLGKRGAIKASDVAGAIDPLKTALKSDKDVTVRKAAAEALGSIGAEPENVVPILIEALKDKDFSLKMGAISALSMYGSKATDALPALRAIAQEKTDKKLSMAANVALKAIGGKKK